jgi:hypothetical protein
LLQIQGAGDEAVVFHRESAATKKMRQDRLARRVKSADDKIGENPRVFVSTDLILA